MWVTAESQGLTQEEINSLAEKLYMEALESSTRKCPDCQVSPGQHHDENCDVARCTQCGGQWIQCGCIGGEPDRWIGLWPGVETAYKHKLICRWDVADQYHTTDWRFDLNRAAIIDQTQDNGDEDEEDEEEEDTNVVEETLNQFQYDVNHNKKIKKAIENLKKLFRNELGKVLTEEQMKSEEFQEWLEDYSEQLRGERAEDIDFVDLLFLNL